jgi:hypothetical protein
MPADFLHNHPQFADLIRIVAAEKGIDPALVEKDYWITQCLYGLQQLGMKFELKGGTSLSKGFQIINRFSEDIDIRLTRQSDSPEPIIRTLQKTRHSFLAIQQRANPIQGPLPRAPRYTTATNQPSIRFSQKLANGPRSFNSLPKFADLGH